MPETPFDAAARALMSGDAVDLVGTWTYHADHDRWTWSPEVFTFLGFTRGEVVPSTDLLLAHLGPTDGLPDPPDGGVLPDGPFARHLRVRDARGRTRSLLLVGRPAYGPDGGEQVSGYLLDLTDWRRTSNEADVQSALQAAGVHRSSIEQAKGALMALHGMSAEEAFAVLVRRSQTANVKLRDVAARMLEELSADGQEGVG